MILPQVSHPQVPKAWRLIDNFGFVSVVLDNDISGFAALPLSLKLVQLESRGSDVVIQMRGQICIPAANKSLVLLRLLTLCIYYLRWICRCILICKSSSRRLVFGSGRRLRV